MPTVITHTVIAGLAGKAVTGKKLPLQFWLLTMLCSVFPDFDVIGLSLGVPYGHFFGHRGFFHSAFFALLLSLFVTCFLVLKLQIRSISWWKLVLFFFLVTASHGILDAFTNGGYGIALLSPFDNTRYFFPWTPIPVSPLSIKNILSGWGLRVIVYEFLYLCLPMAAFYVFTLLIRFCYRKISLFGRHTG